MGLNFKTYLPSEPGYKGGKSKEEVSKGGKKVCKLSSNENPLGSSPLAMKAVQKYLNTLSEYPPPMDGKLRNALSEFYNGALTPDQFVTTNSGVANIELIVRGFLDEGSECIFSNPAFSPYRSFPLKVGAKPINIPLIGNDFQLDLQGIEKSITEKTSLVFVTSPNNPTGTHIGKAQIDALIAMLPEHVLLVFDEVYYQFADAADYVRPLPYVLENKNVIAVNSLSKAYGLAGLRIGYSYSTVEVATYLQKFRRPFMLNTLSMEAAIGGLQDDDFIQQTVELIHQEKKYLYKELDKIGVKYWKTQANFIMIRPPITPLQFEEKMANEGIMVRPLTGFGAPDCVRVTIGTREGNEAYLYALRKVIQ